MRSPLRSLVVLAALLGSSLAPATPGRAMPEPLASRVIVSSTLNSTLHVFDAASLAETQPPLPSKGAGPVRLWVQDFGGTTFLLAANHGVLGSLGVFALDGPLVTELPLSPFPSGGPGSVGVAAGLRHGTTPMIFLTDTVHALGGCGMPHGTVTAYDASLLASAGVARRFATVSTEGSIPYAVAFDGARGEALVSNYCSDTLMEFRVLDPDPIAEPIPVVRDSIVTRTGIATTGAGPDAVLFDETHGLTYVTNIDGNSVSVFGRGLGPIAKPARTTVPLPGAGPIDATLADSPSGARWMITSNGKDDTVSVIDRDAMATCVAANDATCSAQVARIGAGVPGGAPEGVAYDPATNRIFVVNKTIGAPKLSVIQLTEDGGAVSGSVIAIVPLQVLGSDTPVPDLISFDVVVQTR